jgi:phage baseplate assembly protein gpV
MPYRGWAGSRERPGRDMQLTGVYYGIVTQNKDEEKSLGRVKVRFPWMPGGDADQSHWAQLSVPMAGAEFGTWVVPEIDDTVAVVFIAGDIRTPVVIGGIWNEVDTPPEDNASGDNDFRFIKSRSGHRMLLDDSSSTKVVMTDKSNGNYIGVGTFASGGSGDNAMEVATPGGSKGVGAHSGEGTLNIWCPSGTFTVKAKDIEVGASDKLHIKAGGDANLKGSTADMGGGVGLNVDGSKVKAN